MSDVLTVREATREADVTSQHILNLINKGVLKASKFGYQYAIDRASFDAWMIKTGRKQGEQSSQGDQGEAETRESRAHAS